MKNQMNKYIKKHFNNLTEQPQNVQDFVNEVSILIRDFSINQEKLKSKENEIKQKLKNQIITQHIINQLLELSYKELNIEELLQQALEIIFELPFTNLLPKGGIFLTLPNKNELKLIAQKNLGNSLLNICGKENLPYGKCLCGIAAEKQTIIFKSCIDKDHSIKPEGIQPHGHYNVPIISNGKTLGVIVLYLPHGHEKKDYEVNILKSIAKTLALIINKYNTEEERKRAQQRYEDLFENATDLIQSIDKKGNFVYVNKSWKEKLGYTDEEINQLNFIDIIHPSQQMHCMELFKEITLCERKMLVQTIFVSKNGENIYVEGNVSCKISDDEIFTRGIFRDITEQIKAQEKLKESEQQYRKLIETANDIIYQADYKGIFTYVNQKSKPLTGYAPEELLGKHFTFLVTDDYKEKIKEFYFDQFKFRLPSTYCEFPIKTKEGKIKWIGQNVQLVQTEDKKKKEFTAIARDITKTKQIEKELIEARNKAEESARAKEMFLANMSHEIRTPMNAIVGMAGLLKNTKLDNKQKEYIDAIITSADNLLVIINDILDITKIESGKLELEKIDFDLRKLIKDIHKSVYYKAEEKGLLFEYKIDEKTPQFLVGDPVRLNQILFNLIGNAIKFTLEGGITLKVTLKNKNKSKATLVFDVTDTGIGIEEDKLDTIFETFKQEDDSTTRKFGGTGLGLSISKSLVELYGGELKVKSKKNVGTTFWFEITLPIGTGENVRTKSDIKINTNPLKGKKVLLVEDHEINRFLATTILQQWNINVDIAENGVIAVEKVKENTYDAILMDMQMPEMGGVEATKIIRNILHSNVPIIALTANAVKGDAEKCLAAGMNDYLSKPFEPSDLFNKLLNQIKQ
jgi:PAS domain S-box-containing protein